MDLANSDDSLERLDRKSQVIIFRLRTGHCKLKGHMHNKFRVGDSSLCPCNTGAEMTPFYILQECPNFTQQRNKFWPEKTSERQKLFGSLEDLGRTVQFVRETTLII